MCHGATSFCALLRKTSLQAGLCCVWLRRQGGRQAEGECTEWCSSLQSQPRAAACAGWGPTSHGRPSSLTHCLMVHSARHDAALDSVTQGPSDVLVEVVLNVSQFHPVVPGVLCRLGRAVPPKGYSGVCAEVWLRMHVRPAEGGASTLMYCSQSMAVGRGGMHMEGAVASALWWWRAEARAALCEPFALPPSISLIIG